MSAPFEQKKRLRHARHYAFVELIYFIVEKQPGAVGDELIVSMSSYFCLCLLINHWAEDEFQQP